MKLIRVRHDLDPAAKALLASLGFDYIVTADAPECVTWADGRDVTLQPGRCPKCKAVAKAKT